MAEFHAGGFLYDPKTRSILLHKRDLHTKNNPGKWAFFGGTSEAGETPEQSFIREIKEELGIELIEKELRPLCNYFNEQKGIYRHIFYVESDLKKSQMHLGEGADFDWIPLEKVFEYDLSEKTARDLRYFLQMVK